MARLADDPTRTQMLLPSVLDRLTDHDREFTFLDFRYDRSKILNHLRSAVRENLEWLLNARQDVELPGNDHPNLKTSVAIYGLPDLTSAPIAKEQARKRLIEAIEMAISKFEPRLTEVRVEAMPSREVERKAKFQIKAKLIVEPAPEPVQYVTALELGTNTFEFE